MSCCANLAGPRNENLCSREAALIFACDIAPLDFIDVVRERWQLTNLPCDKTSLNQICCAFVGILSLRDVTDARRVVREETGPLSTADPKTKILANQNPPKKGL